MFSVLEARLELRRLVSEWGRWAERIAEVAESVLGPAVSASLEALLKGGSRELVM